MHETLSGQYLIYQRTHTTLSHSADPPSHLQLGRPRAPVLLTSESKLLLGQELLVQLGSKLFARAASVNARRSVHVRPKVAHSLQTSPRAGDDVPTTIPQTNKTNKQTNKQTEASGAARSATDVHYE